VGVALCARTCAAARLERGDTRAAEPFLGQGDRTALPKPSAEVRRISRELRPSILDDLGLSALKTLVESLHYGTGVKMPVQHSGFRNRLDDEAKICTVRGLHKRRLTNIEAMPGHGSYCRPGGGHRRGDASISDRRVGLIQDSALFQAAWAAHMQERIETALPGRCLQASAQGGTQITATVR